MPKWRLVAPKQMNGSGDGIDKNIPKGCVIEVVSPTTGFGPNAEDVENVLRAHGFNGYSLSWRSSGNWECTMIDKETDFDTWRKQNEAGAEAKKEYERAILERNNRSSGRKSTIDIEEKEAKIDKAEKQANDRRTKSKANSRNEGCTGCSLIDSILDPIIDSIPGLRYVINCLCK